MSLYRIITENKNRADIQRLLQKRFDGFTLFRATGSYTNAVGTHIEPALIIEIDLDGSGPNDGQSYKDVAEVAQQIKSMNQQEKVLVQQIPCISELI